MKSKKTEKQIIKSLETIRFALVQLVHTLDTELLHIRSIRIMEDK